MALCPWWLLVMQIQENVALNTLSGLSYAEKICTHKYVADLKLYRKYGRKLTQYVVKLPMFIKLSIALQRAWWYLQNPLILYFQKRNVYHMRSRVLREEEVKRVINNIMKRLLEFASQIHFLGQVTSFKIMDFLHDSFFRSQNHIFTWQLINVYLLFHDYFVSPSLTEKDSCKRQGFKAK